MSVDTAIASWEGLVRIAGDHAKVHITGGEPFLFFDRLAQICEQAAKLGLTPVDSIETNAGVFENETDLKGKLHLLDRCGLSRLKISWDAFHEEFVDLEKVRQFIAISQNVLGPDRVLVRWEKHLDNPTGVRKQNEGQKKQILLEAMKADSCRFTGRAADILAPLIAQYASGVFQGRDCQKALLGSKGVHIDPFGNVFNGQCSGMILGNVLRTPLDILWKSFQPDRQDFWSTLYEKGPFGWLRLTCQKGYSVRTHYASKCHLCTDIRRFFFDKGIYSQIIGPSDCYNSSE